MSVYNGFWVEDKRHGDGTLTYIRSGNEFKGAFVKDSMTEGKRTYKSGSKYDEGTVVYNGTENSKGDWNGQVCHF